MTGTSDSQNDSVNEEQSPPSTTVIKQEVGQKDETSDIIDMLLKSDHEMDSPTRKKPQVVMESPSRIASRQRHRAKKTSLDSAVKFKTHDRASLFELPKKTTKDSDAKLKEVNRLSLAERRKKAATDSAVELKTRDRSSLAERQKKVTDSSAVRAKTPGHPTLIDPGMKTPPRLLRTSRPHRNEIINDPVKSLFPTLPSPLPSDQDGLENLGSLNDGLRRLLQDEEMMKFAVEVDQV